MFGQSDFFKLLVLLLILKAAASETENEIDRNKRTVNTTIFWYFGDDKELQTITKEVKSNGDNLKEISNSILEAVKSNSEAIAQMRNDLQNISLRMDAYIRPKKVFRHSLGPSSCADLLNKGGRAGVYTLYFDTNPVKYLRVYCEHDPDGGPAWTIIQRITSGEPFTNRTWDDYENGFGDIEHDHWLGLKNLYELQNMLNGSMELWIKQKFKNYDLSSIKYRDFSIESSNTSYALKAVKDYERSGMFYDYFKNSIGRKFTMDYKRCYRSKGDGWWCDKDGECCYGVNHKYVYIDYTHMAIRPNSAK